MITHIDKTERERESERVKREREKEREKKEETRARFSLRKREEAFFERVVYLLQTTYAYFNMIPVKSFTRNGKTYKLPELPAP